MELDAAARWYGPKLRLADGPRLPVLADRARRWMASRHGRREGGERLIQVQDPTIGQLVAT